MIKVVLLSTLVTSVASAADKKRQPDWFAGSTHTLMPLIEAKKGAQRRMLQTSSIADHKALCRSQ